MSEAANRPFGDGRIGVAGQRHDNLDQPVVVQPLEEAKRGSADLGAAVAEAVGQLIAKVAGHRVDDFEQAKTLLDRDFGDHGAFDLGSRARTHFSQQARRQLPDPKVPLLFDDVDQHRYALPTEAADHLSRPLLPVGLSRPHVIDE